VNGSVRKIVDDSVNPLKLQINDMKDSIQNLNDRVDKLSDRMQKVESVTNEIQLTLENETNKQIKIIAEGHLDLSRKLTESLKVRDNQEMLLLRVNVLENEVRRLKQV
ncbi:MAG: hypothetical protein Q4F21_09830, partial [Lachnospiraceae bacterium]|nr:hypothetical protein [Lachnospiraceae bacterium]